MTFHFIRFTNGLPQQTLRTAEYCYCLPGENLFSSSLKTFLSTWNLVETFQRSLSTPFETSGAFKISSSSLDLSMTNAPVWLQQENRALSKCHPTATSSMSSEHISAALEAPNSCPLSNHSTMPILYASPAPSLLTYIRQFNIFENIASSLRYRRPKFTVSFLHIESILILEFYCCKKKQK